MSFPKKIIRLKGDLRFLVQLTLLPLEEEREKYVKNDCSWCLTPHGWVPLAEKLNLFPTSESG